MVLFRALRDKPPTPFLRRLQVRQALERPGTPTMGNWADTREMLWSHFAAKGQFVLLPR
jgi:hypothetical protein